MVYLDAFFFFSFARKFIHLAILLHLILTPFLLQYAF